MALTTHPILSPGSCMGKAISPPLLCACLACNETAFTFIFYDGIKCRGGGMETTEMQFLWRNIAENNSLEDFVKSCEDTVAWNVGNRVLRI
jgi:hypothetical protein